MHVYAKQTKIYFKVGFVDDNIFKITMLGSYNFTYIFRALLKANIKTMI